MPATIQADGTQEDATLDTLREDLRTILAAHCKDLTRLVVERRNRGPASGPLSKKILVKRGDEETDDELVGSCVDQTFAVIMRDARVPRGRGPHPNAGLVGPWEGAVLVFVKKDAKKPIDTLPVHIEYPEELLAPSVDSELVKMASAFTKSNEAMATKLIAIYGQLGKREKHQARMFKAMAIGQVGLSKSASKYKYREAKEREETERADIAARERTARRKFFWEAVESIGVEWKDVGEIWSKYYTHNRSPGDGKKTPPPTRPTEEECKKIFEGSQREHFERQHTLSDGSTTSVRALVAQMIAEPDFSRRQALAKLLTECSSKIPDREKVLRAAFGESKIDAERAMSIIAWLSLPIT
jgi:hypothetical protein